MTPHLGLAALLNEPRQEDLGLGLRQVVARRLQLLKDRLGVVKFTSNEDKGDRAHSTAG